MTRVWTEEQKQKAAATRAATKAAKAERAAKKESRFVHLSEVADYPDGIEPAESNRPNPIAMIVSVPQNGFDWKKSPLEEVMGRLANMKREYDRCTQIVLSRQSVTRPNWTCWTQFHKELVPKSVTALCRKSGPDGKWASRDDGVFKEVDGIRVPDPVFCCSALCHELYLKSKPMQSLSRH